MLSLCTLTWACAHGPQGSTSPESLPGVINPQGPAAEWRAINRLTYGPTPTLIQDIQSKGHPKEWALAHLQAARQASLKPPRLPPDLASINDSLPNHFEGVRREREARAAFPAGTAFNEGATNAARFEFREPADALYFNRSQLYKAVAWRVASCSSDDVEQGLLARLTEFWFNHFNVYQHKGPVRPFVGHYVLHVARAHALGRFEDLVLASARHPAMLYYLDQWNSVSPQSERAAQGGRGLNENYARELMELHTLGVNGGYSQQDVRALARVLTGWTVAPQAVDGFQFVARFHDSGSKTVMGLTLPGKLASPGEDEGVQAIRFLANHPATAQRVSRRLAEYFVADAPSEVLVERMAKTFLATRGDLYEVMRVLLGSEDFWNPANRLYRTPFEFACASLRVLNAGQDRAKWVEASNYAAAAGQGIHDWPTPDGYAFSAELWLKPEALTRRIDFALSIARGGAERPEFGPYLSENTLKAVMKQAPAQRAGFVLGSPEFQFK